MDGGSLIVDRVDRGREARVGRVGVDADLDFRVDARCGGVLERVRGPADDEGLVVERLTRVVDHSHRARGGEREDLGAVYEARLGGSDGVVADEPLLEPVGSRQDKLAGGLIANDAR
jgi:hypothetical protein